MTEKHLPNSNNFSLAEKQKWVFILMNFVPDFGYPVPENWQIGLTVNGRKYNFHACAIICMYILCSVLSRDSNSAYKELELLRV